MKSLLNAIKIYLDNPTDTDIERVIERYSNKNNTVKLYHKKKQLEEENERLECLIVDILTSIPSHFLEGYPDWDNELTRIEESCG